MTRNVKREIYTTTQPDGTLVTTTTITKSLHEQDIEYSFGKGELDKQYCCRPQGALRIVQIILGLIIISLIVSVYGPGPFKGILFGQTILLIFAGIAFCITFIYLVSHFFNLHESHLDFFPWKSVDVVICGVAAIFYLVMGFLEGYYATGAWSNNCNDIGGDGIIANNCRLIYEWLFAAIFCFINAILYAISCFLITKKRSYDDDDE
uniref:MARVEL domain-containing protein n=1 Tax=Rhabditophanes sp. KR3021 TaxID=114890 RepID=A0AC35TGZ9_9BILA